MTAMNIMEQVSNIVEKLTANKSLLDSFQKDPVKTVESLLGINLPDEQIKQVISGINAKLTGDKLSNVASALKKLF